MSDIIWRNERRKLSEIQGWELNPKRLSEKQGDGLRVSIEKFGFAVPLLISPDDEIYDGHQRKAILELIDEYGPDAEIDVRVSSRPLTFDERRELVVRLKQNQADWDFDALANIYEPEELKDWGFENWQLPDFAYGDTSTDRDGQGVSSTWSQVNESEFIKVVIGDIETRIDSDLYDKLISCLESFFNRDGTSVFETFQAIIMHGCDEVCNS